MRTLLYIALFYLGFFACVVAAAVWGFAPLEAYIVNSFPEYAKLLSIVALFTIIISVVAAYVFLFFKYMSIRCRHCGGAAYYALSADDETNCCVKCRDCEGTFMVKWHPNDSGD